MRKIILDTSFLITLLDDQRPNHAVALQYYKYCLENGHLLYVSTISISEYCLKGKISELPLENLIILPFNIEDAAKSSELNFKDTLEDGESRTVVKDDYKIIGQAEVKNCDFILTDDVNTLHRHVTSLKSAGKINLDAITLERFNPALITGDTADAQMDIW